MKNIYNVRYNNCAVSLNTLTHEVKVLSGEEGSHDMRVVDTTTVLILELATQHYSDEGVEELIAEMLENLSKFGKYKRNQLALFKKELSKIDSFLKYLQWLRVGKEKVSELGRDDLTRPEIKHQVVDFIISPTIEGLKKFRGYM